MNIGGVPRPSANSLQHVEFLLRHLNVVESVQDALMH